jgi:ATP-dependent DNA ligase
VLYTSGPECYIRSKRGKVLSRFGELALRVGVELHARDAILDGEVVALDDEAEWISGPCGWLHYVAFDLLWLIGKDLRALPLIKRKRRLEQRSRGARARAVRSAQRLDLEGIVAKRRADP